MANFTDRSWLALKTGNDWFEIYTIQNDSDIYNLPPLKTEDGEDISWIDSFEIDNLDRDTAITLILPPTIKGVKGDFPDISKLIFSEGLKYIGTKTFSNKHIPNLRIPLSTRKIGDQAFFDSEIEDLTIADTEEFFKNFDSIFGKNRIKTLRIRNVSSNVLNCCTYLKNSPSLYYLEDIYIEDTPLYSQGLISLREYFPKAKIHNSDELKPEETLLTIDDGTWLIINGVLYGYYGIEKDIVIPDGVISIYGYALSNRGLTSIDFPNSLIQIGVQACSKNELTEERFPPKLEYVWDNAFSDNPIEKVDYNMLTRSIPLSVFLDSAITECTCHDVALNSILEKNKIEKLTIVRGAFVWQSITRMLENFENLKELTLVGYDLGFFKKREFLKELNWIFKGKVTINFQELEDYEKEDNTQPPELKDELECLLDEIKSISVLLGPEGQTALDKKVERLLLAYKSDIEKASKNNSYPCTKDISLTLDPPSLELDKAILLSRLKNIISELKSDESLKFLKDLEEYRTLVESDSTKYETGHTTRNKIEYITEVANTLEMPILKNLLLGILEEASVLAKDSLTRYLDLEMSTRQEQVATFEEKIDSLLFTVTAAVPVLAALTQSMPNRISALIEIVKFYLSVMAPEDRQSYEESFYTMLADIKESLLLSPSQITEDQVRIRLEEFKATLDPLLLLSMRKKKLDENRESLIYDLTYALESPKKEDIKKSPIRDMVQEIIALITENIHDLEKKSEMIEDAKKIIRRWKKICNDGLIEEELKKLKTKRLQQAGDDSPLLPELSVYKMVELYILKQLFDLKWQVDTYKESQAIIDRHKKDLKLLPVSNVRSDRQN